MAQIISPDVLTTLLLALGFAGLVLGFDWLRARLERPKDRVAAE